MDVAKQEQIQAHARAIAALLYDETAPEQLTTLEGIEVAVRGHILEQISPQIGLFLSTQPAAAIVGDGGTSKASSAPSVSQKLRQPRWKSLKAAPMQAPICERSVAAATVCAPALLTKA